MSKLDEQTRDEKFFDENGLPEFCYCYNELQGNGTIIKRGESGYFPLDYDCPMNVVKHLNERLEIDYFQVEAMKNGSMWGWDTPSAMPQTWIDEEAKGMDIVGLVYKTD